MSLIMNLIVKKFPTVKIPYYGKLSLVLLLCQSGLYIGAQVRCVEIPKNEIKIYSASLVKQDGKILKKGNKVLLPEQIPSYPTKTFFECSQLSFDKGGLLQFPYQGKLVSFTYDDYMGNKVKFIASSNNAASRGSEKYCTKTNDGEAYLDFLSNTSVVLQEVCLYNFFNHPKYFLFENETLEFPDEKSTPETIDFVNEKKEVFQFKKQGNRIVIHPEILPEEMPVKVYEKLAGTKTLLAQGILVINLKKIITRLKKEGYSSETIRDILLQNYFISADKNFSSGLQIQMAKKLDEVIQKVI